MKKVEQLKTKLDFPNPIEHIDIGDKPIKLKELSMLIENQAIMVVFSETIADFNTFTAKITAGKDCLILEKWIWGYRLLKRYANKINKPIVLRINSKKQNKLIKTRWFTKHIKSAIRLSHKPYYYIAGCKSKSKKFDIGWTVIGISTVI